MNRKRRLTERITDSSYVEDLSDKSIEELRSMREECSEGENEVSFERRLCQARIDILSAELSRREGDEQGDLVSRLPEILGGGLTQPSEAPLPDRAPDFSIPRNADVPRRRIEEIVGEETLARLQEIEPDEIRDIIRSIGDHERNLSEKRKDIHEVMDLIQGEIVRRYTSGEADPTAALR
ncbi:MAG: hypothetical protein M3280_12660 [Actinomycetota bacterium]|nr:hypothetical protein [Actinomycetota bacterium]